MKIFSLSIALFALAVAAHAVEPPSAPAAKLSDFKLGPVITGPDSTLTSAAGKAVLIDAWGIHCGPCLKLLPEVEKISRRYKNKLVVFGAHSQPGTDDEVKEVVKDNKLSYTITKGVQSTVPVAGLPWVFLFDAGGNLLFSGNPENQDFERSLRKAVAGTSGAGGAAPSGLDALKKPSGLDALKKTAN